MPLRPRGAHHTCRGAHVCVCSSHVHVSYAHPRPCHGAPLVQSRLRPSFESPTPRSLKEQYGRFSLFLEKTSICLRRHNGIINNYILKFQKSFNLHLQPKSGARVMPIWCAHGACLARSRCQSDSPAVRVQYVSGSPAAFSLSPWSLNHQTSRISLLSA